MKTNMGLWIDHRKAVIVAVSGKGEETSVIESNAEKQPGRFDGERSTTPYESQKVPADGRQDIKFADKLNIYYDEVISVLRDAESILLFGPGEAKGELKKRLEDDYLAHLIQAVETVDQMTDPRLQRKSGSILTNLPSAKKAFSEQSSTACKKKRYASGEINTEEFDRKKKDLE
jgi:hypothetical protein